METCTCHFCLVCVEKRISHQHQQELKHSFLIQISALSFMSSSVETLKQKTRAATSISAPNLVNMLSFPTRTYPIESFGGTTVIHSEKWDAVLPDYFTTSKWETSISSSSGRHQYVRFVQCIVRRVCFNASNEAEMRAFSTLILSEDSHEFLWLAMPELPDCEQPPPDGSCHTQLLQLVNLLKPTVLKRKKNYRKYLQKRQRSSETQNIIDLSKLNLGLNEEQKKNFAQAWFFDRNHEEPIGADQERLFKSHIALAYPECAVDHTETLMQKTFRQPTKVDCLGLPRDLCLPGENLPAEVDLSGLPFVSPSSGQELPGVSRHCNAGNPHLRRDYFQDPKAHERPETVLRAHKSVAQDLVNPGCPTTPVRPTTVDAQLFQNGETVKHTQTLHENIVPQTNLTGGTHFQNHDATKVRDFAENDLTNRHSKPTAHALATGLSDSQASYINDRLTQKPPKQPPQPDILMADSISARFYDEQPAAPFTSEQMADYIVKGHTDPTYRLNIPREKALEDRARITPKPSPYGGSYLGPEVGTSIDSSMNQYYIGRMSPGPGQAPKEFSQIGFRPDDDAWKWLLGYKGAPLSARDRDRVRHERVREGLERREEEREKMVVMRRATQVGEKGRSESEGSEGGMQMASREKKDVVTGGVLKPEPGQGMETAQGQRRPKVKKQVSFKEEVD